MKSFSGDLLERNNKSKELIHLATDILNKGLRPHLTKYQAKFRKWYEEKLEEEKEKSENNKKTPQEIQREYANYKELIASMKTVTTILIKYKVELEKILRYEKQDPPTMNCGKIQVKQIFFLWIDLFLMKAFPLKN